MKVNKKKSIGFGAILVFSFFAILGIRLFAEPANSQTNKEPDVVFDMKCVAADKDGSYKTVYIRNDILDFSTSSENGDVVFTLFFSDDRKSYELVPVEPNTLCSVSKRIEVN